MTSLQANCPACGAQVIFKTGSAIVRVCDHCHSVVARTDRGLEDVGRVAEVAESGSPLETGLRGVCRGVAFELTGRAQLGHSMGGMWDEWYAAFADGRWGWLAEAQGRFYLTFQNPVPDPSLIPPFEALELGQPFPAVPSQPPPVVTEIGEARMLAAEGEIPYRLVPGEAYPYADLSGLEGGFGTVDYGESPPLVFVGREVTLADLGVAQTGRTRERDPRVVAAARLNCPNCAGPLELRAPDKTERVTCPNCGSLLDVNQGQLKFLKALEPKGPAPSLPLGAAAEFEGQPFTLIGFMARSVEFEGVRYFWQEYLLYNPAAGFRWLVESDGHWSYVRAVPPGEVSEPAPGKSARYGGRSFKIFQAAAARAEYVQGEFYWKVTVGEQARAIDFVSPPQMLSKEISYAGDGDGGKKRKGAGGEINWSLGTYVPVREIERKFKVDLPSPHTIAPNQPFKHKSVYTYWLLLTFVTLVVGLAVMATGSRTTVFNRSYSLEPAAAAPRPTPPAPGASGRELQQFNERLRQSLNARNSIVGSEGTQVIFSEPFRLEGGRNIRVSGEANVENNWLYVAGDLINEETGLVQQFDLPIEFYAGVEGGESWSEGGRRDAAHLSALPAGTYTMRLEAQWEKWNKAEPPQLSIRVEQGVPRFLNLLLALLALAAVPVLVGVYHMNFEKRRWADSAFNPSGGGDNDSDE